MNAKTYQATIYIAGDLNKIKDTCREWCLRGACVTITPTDYIYTGGSETGAAIGIINYPRFESTPDKIKTVALELANLLLIKCHQRSCTVLCSDETEYVQNNAITIPR